MLMRICIEGFLDQFPSYDKYFPCYHFWEERIIQVAIFLLELRRAASSQLISQLCFTFMHIRVKNQFKLLI